MTTRLQLEPLFPVALARLELQPDPLDTALLLRAIHNLRGEASSNPDPACAWTGDLHGQEQLHRHPDAAPLIRLISAQAWGYLQALGFDPTRTALHIQRCWPVVSEPGQIIGRHHHPNAHLSAVYYLNGDGSGRSGCLRLWPPNPINELVPGLAVGHGGPIDPQSQGARIWNAPWIDVAPRAGLLLLFPSRLEHGVLANEDDDTRFSISLDFSLSAPGSGQSAASAQTAEYLAPHPGRWMEIPPPDSPGPSGAQG